MIVLGIESTAHTFGIGIIKDKQVLANVNDSYTTESGGMIPVQSAEHHVECCDRVLKTALEKANISLHEVDVIAYSRGHGMGHCLRREIIRMEN